MGASVNFSCGVPAISVCVSSVGEGTSSFGAIVEPSGISFGSSVDASAISLGADGLTVSSTIGSSVDTGSALSEGFSSIVGPSVEVSIGTVS